MSVRALHHLHLLADGTFFFISRKVPFHARIPLTQSARRDVDTDKQAVAQLLAVQNVDPVNPILDHAFPFALLAMSNAAQLEYAHH